MSSDARMSYADTYKEYAKLKARASEMVQMVYKVGQQLNQTPTNAVFAAPGAPKEVDGRTLFENSQWPSAADIQTAIKSWMDTKASLDKIWETIPEGDRPGLLVPPTLSLSQKVG